MEKIYLKPEMKMVVMGDELMVDINQGSINDDFTEGAKGMNFDDDTDSDFQTDSRSVWDD